MVMLVAVEQLVEKSTSDPKFEGSNPAAGGTGKKLQKIDNKASSNSAIG